MNRDSKLIYEKYLLKEAPAGIHKKRKHEQSPPPAHDSTKSRLFNKVIWLNHEFLKDFKIDPNTRYDSDQACHERYESIAGIAGTTIDKVRAAVEKGIDPAPKIHRPVSDPYQGTYTAGDAEHFNKIASHPKRFTGKITEY